MRVANATENLVKIKKGECAGYLQSDPDILIEDLESSLVYNDPMGSLSAELDEAFPKVLALREEPLLERPIANPLEQARLVTESYEPVVCDSMPALLTVGERSNLPLTKTATQLDLEQKMNVDLLSRAEGGAESLDYQRKKKHQSRDG